MRINNIQNDRYPIFGALIFKPNSAQYTSTLGQRALEHISVVSEQLKNTKFYNLEIRDTFVITHSNGDRIYPPYRVDKAGNCLMIRGRWGADTVSKRIRFKSPSEMLKAHKDISESETQVLRTGKIVKYLDDYEGKLSNKNS